MMILASTSASRAAMMAAACIPYRAVAAHVDEAAVKAALLADHAVPRDIADALAELKAIKVSRAHPGQLVLGGDSIVALADGTLLDKPVDRADAAAQLRQMAGAKHDLISAAVIALDGAAIWRHVDVAQMHVRPLSDAFIEAYLDREWPTIAGCVGCYRIEGPGVQLFSRIAGSHFTIMGMPLLPIIDFLRVRGVLLS
jgi:septum formation protein